MERSLPLPLILAMVAVVLVLLTGVAGFAKGGDWYSRNANRLMNLRVAAQGLAVALLAAAIYLSQP
jgi:hypothetical protein